MEGVRISEFGRNECGGIIARKMILWEQSGKVNFSPN